MQATTHNPGCNPSNNPQSRQQQRGVGVGENRGPTVPKAVSGNNPSRDPQSRRQSKPQSTIQVTIQAVTHHPGDNPKPRSTMQATIQTRTHNPADKVAIRNPADNPAHHIRFPVYRLPVPQIGGSLSCSGVGVSGCPCPRRRAYTRRKAVTRMLRTVNPNARSVIATKENPLGSSESPTQLPPVS